MSYLDIEENSKEGDNNITLSSSINTNTNSSEKNEIDDNEAAIEYNREEETKLKPNSEKLNNNNIGTKKYLLYGNHIDNLKPKYLGKARALCYINNYPIIIIGPDCKFYFSFKFI
jgi:hypothetical protein